MSIYRDITPHGYRAMVLASFGAILYGFDNGWWGKVLGENEFLCAYGSKSTSTSGIFKCNLSTSQQSAGTGVGPAGVVIGCVLAMYLNAYLGRRMSLVCTAVVSLIGIVIEMTSATGSSARYGQFIAGKIFNSIGMGLTANIVPIYLSETSVSAARGFVINMYQTIQIVGIVVASAVVYAVSKRTDRSAFLIPMGVQAVAPGLMLLSSPFIPESPRWLVWKGRKEEAVKAANALFSTPSNTFNAEEYCYKLEVAYEEEKRASAGTGWLDLIRQPDLRRVLIATGVQSLQHAQGSSYMTSYIVSFLIGIGVKDYFPIVMALNCVYFAAVCTGYFLPDMFGRRSLLLGPSALCGICLICVAALVTAYPVPPPAVQKASIGLIFIWEFSFGLQGPAVWIVTTESAPARNREKVLGVATFFGFGVGLMITFVSPYIQNKGYGDLGSKIGFIWGSFSIIMVIYTFFFVPEYKGFSLEQIDYLFETKVPTRKFASFQFTDDILATVTDDVKDTKEDEARMEVEEVKELV